MTTLTVATLWQNHPYPAAPCSTQYFANQCAIRMGVALEASGVDTASFDTIDSALLYAESIAGASTRHHCQNGNANH